MSQSTWLLAEVLLNAAWIGVLVYLAALALGRLPGAGPGFKAAIGLAALAAAVLLPAFQQAEWPAPPPPTTAEASVPILMPPPAPLPATPDGMFRLPAGPLAEALVRTWVLGALAGLGWLVAGVAAALRLKRRARLPGGEWAARERRWTASSTPRARLLLSAETPSPVAVGWLRPAVLFPPALAESLGEDELERLWLHEAAHLERRDDWLILVERASLALLWFHPSAWAIARRVAAERELACDALAAERSGSPQDYARTLTRLAELRLARGAAPALSVAGSANLSRRIEMLLQDRPAGAGRLGRAGLTLASAVSVAAIGAVLAVGPLVGLAQSPPPAPPAPAAPATPPTPAVPAAKAAPPAPPAPTAKSAPSPRPAPVPTPAPQPRPAPVPPVPQLDAETQAEIDALSEELRGMSEEIRRQVEADLQPFHEAMHALSQQMQAKHEPFAERMRDLAREIAQLQRQQPLTEERQRAIEEKSRRIEEHSKAFEASAREIEEKMRALELEMKPNEERIREIEQKMRARAAELEKRIEEKMRQRSER